MLTRADIRAWLEANCPASMRSPGPAEEEVWGGSKERFVHPDARLWLERMRDRRWIAPTWPVEYGGGGLSDAEARMLDEELRRLGCRLPLRSLGLWMLGPVLLEYGSEAQKREHLPRIARGEVRWCQGYSEPGAGSDLASLACRAERDGDCFVVHGQKIWTSHADLADWMFFLVRTDPDAPKREGITFLLIDMTTPGIAVRPIRLISGASPFCESFFDGVRVPVANVVGDVNQGWTVAKAVLGHERQAISRLRDARHEETDSLESIADRYGVDDPVLRDRIARVNIDFLANALTLQRSAQAPGPETAVFKYVGTEINKRRKELRVLCAGYRGLGWESDAFTSDERTYTREWLRSRASSIEGGTSEIQLNIIAKRVLGLPAGHPRPGTPLGHLSEEQRAIHRAARALAREHAPINVLRRLRDERDPLGFGRELWRELAKLDFIGMSIPDDAGGAGLGFAELGVVLEELGRTLAPTPLLSTVALGASALAAGDASTLRGELLPRVCRGELVLGFAHDEGTRFDRGAVAARAVRAADGWAVTGVKTFVLDGHVAEWLIASAHDGDELALFAIPASAGGVAIERISTVDSRNVARAVFQDVRVSAAHRVGGRDLLDLVLDRGAIALSAEMLGGMQEAFDRTLDYLCTREQFGARIGSFQALQHRAALMYCELELTRSIVWAALRAADDGAAQLPQLAAAAKARANDTFLLIANEAIQMHGGVGVTDECDIGLFLKRARAAEMTLGTSSHHRHRFGGLA